MEAGLPQPGDENVRCLWPRQKNAGAKTDTLVELTDVYPALMGLCGLPIPKGLQGVSLAPLLEDPARQWKEAAFGQYPCSWFEDGKPAGVVRRTMRTCIYRHTEWLDCITGETPARELYDRESGPAHTHDLADQAEYTEVIQKLSAM